MSYIRCLSNPENLYIISTLSGYTEFFLGAKDSEKSSVSMPPGVFDGLLKKYVRQDCEDGSMEGKELYQYQGASLKFLAPPEQQELFGQVISQDWKWFLHYQGWEKPIEMWEVTLDYIASEAKREYQQELLLEQIKEKFQTAGNLTPVQALEAFQVWLASDD